MNFFTPGEITENYSNTGAKKATAPVLQLILLGILAGFIIAVGSAATNTATHTITDSAVSRIIYGLLFPFGLGMVIVLGAELFTGNNMIIISVLDGKAKISGMLRNWLIVYFANFFGAVLLAAGCAFFGQFNYSDGGLAVYTMNVALKKSTMTFENAVVLGIFCNLLVCIGVLCSLSAKSTSGRIIGAYIPIAFFVLSGFEHSIANMYYISAGLFAKLVPSYAAKAIEMGVNLEMLTWSNMIFKNLIPVTLGNTIGGLLIGIIFWACYLRKTTK